ncbi:MAG: hypothetical protein IPM29_12985 [Planctomycetes bacterium]|nr:hypothetical protein [Planctomycetota bacterium]
MRTAPMHWITNDGTARRLRLAALLLAGLAVVGCRGESAGPAGGGPAATAPARGGSAGPSGDDTIAGADAHPYGFAVWHEDFPGAPEHPALSPRVPGRTYVSTRAQALDAVVSKLQGNCTRNAWLFARDVFSRARGEAVVSALVRALELALQSPTGADHAENLLGALAQVGDPAACPAVLRALDHHSDAIRDAAMDTLQYCGDAAALLRAWELIDRAGGRGLAAWIRGAARALPPDEFVPRFRAILADRRLASVHRVVLEEAVKLPAALALSIFSNLVGQEPAELRATIAVLRHLTGDGGGSVLVRDILLQEAPQSRISAVQALRIGGARDFLDELLRLTEDPDPTVRLETVKTLAAIPGETVDLALDSRTEDEFIDVRRAALTALAARGFDRPLQDLAEQVRRGTGSRVQAALEDLVAARYVGTIPAVVERLRGTTGREREGLLRAMALTTCAEAFGPLRDELLSDEPYAVEQHEFVAYLMANCRGAELAVVELFDDLPRDDYRRRAWLVQTLANIAADRAEADARETIYGLFRRLLRDREEIPQMRLLALEYLRRDLTFDDVVPLRAQLTDEEPPMRAALADFLFEYF